MQALFARRASSNANTNARRQAILNALRAYYISDPNVNAIQRNNFAPINQAIYDYMVWLRTDLNRRINAATTNAEYNAISKAANSLPSARDRQRIQNKIRQKRGQPTDINRQLANLASQINNANMNKLISIYNQVQKFPANNQRVMNISKRIALRRMQLLSNQINNANLNKLTNIETQVKTLDLPNTNARTLYNKIKARRNALEQKTVNLNSVANAFVKELYSLTGQKGAGGVYIGPSYYNHNIINRLRFNKRANYQPLSGANGRAKIINAIQRFNIPKTFNKNTRRTRMFNLVNKFYNVRG